MTATPSPASSRDQPVDLRLGADIDAARRLVEDQDLAAWSAASGRSAPSAGCRRTGSRSARACRASSPAARPSSPRSRASTSPSADEAGLDVAAVAARRSACSPGRRASGSSRSPCGPRSGRPCRGASRSLGESIATVWPLIQISPEVAGVTPKIVSATLLRPEPTRPATPRISPARTSNETSWKTPLRVRSLTDSTTSPIGTASFGNIWVISRPTIMRMMSSRVTSLGGVRADILAVAEHRELVGDLEQLVHLVGDVDDAFALRPQVADDLEQMRDLALGQRRGRLVHDQDVGFVGHRLGDLDHLPVGDRQVAHLDLGIDLDVEPLEQLRGLAAQLAMIDEAEARSSARGGSRCSRPPS